MNKEEDIVSFTFAELAFMLMYAIFASYYLIEGLTEKKVEDLENELKANRQQITLLKNEYEELKKKEELKSKQPPTCIEKNIPRLSGGVGFLFETTVLDADTYRINEQDLDIKGVLKLYGADISNAKACGCYHSIIVKHTSNIEIGDYLNAKQRLAMHFAIAER